MKLQDINPFLRYVRNIGFRPINNTVCPFDYHFYYILKGSGEIRIDNETYRIEPAMVILIVPGTGYLFSVYSDLELMDINFDYTHNHSFISEGVPPVSLNRFNEGDIFERVDFEDFPFLNRSLVLYNVQNITKELNAIATEQMYKKKYHNEIISSFFKSVIFKLARFYDSKQNSDAKINLILDYIHQHYSEKLDNTMLADLVGYHPLYINTHFKMHTGITYASIYSGLPT